MLMSSGVVNLFSPSDFDPETLKGQVPEEHIEFLRLRPGDILRTVHTENEYAGMIKLCNFKPEEGTALLMTCISFDPESHLNTVELRVRVYKSALEQFIRLCFDTYKKLSLLYANVPTDEPDRLSVYSDFGFVQLALPLKELFTDHGGIPYYTLTLARLK